MPSSDCSSSEHDSWYLAVSRLRLDYGVYLDFHQHIGGNQGGDADHSGGGAHIAEKLTMRFANLFPIGDLDQKRAGANHILQGGPCLRQGRLHNTENLYCLGVRVSLAHHLAILHGGGPGDMNVRTPAHGAGVADDGFPRGTTGDVLTCHYTVPPLPACHIFAMPRLAASECECQ